MQRVRINGFTCSQSFPLLAQMPAQRRAEALANLEGVDGREACRDAAKAAIAHEHRR